MGASFGQVCGTRCASRGRSQSGRGGPVSSSQAGSFVIPAARTGRDQPRARPGVLRGAEPMGCFNRSSETSSRTKRLGGRTGPRLACNREAVAGRLPCQAPPAGEHELEAPRGLGKDAEHGPDAGPSHPRRWAESSGCGSRVGDGAAGLDEHQARVKRLSGEHRNDAYMRVWSAMRGLRESAYRRALLVGAIANLLPATGSGGSTMSRPSPHPGHDPG